MDAPLVAWAGLTALLSAAVAETLPWPRSAVWLVGMAALSRVGAGRLRDH